ncbi:MAG: hypothetical protein JSS09_00225 [Verrucomicrobia bacterium]|nr:hypothetical protein [Verrucomicrobiota bacterium]
MMTLCIKNVQSLCVKHYYKMVAGTGIEPATQGFSVLVKHFSKIPLVVLNYPTSPNHTEENRLDLGNFGN